MALGLVTTLLLSACTLAVLGRRATVDTDLDLRVDEHSADVDELHMQGSQCNKEGKQEFWDRFEIGRKYGKPCSEQKKWGHELSYKHPDDPEYIALYLYPAEDHNGAFNICDGATFSTEFCARVLTQSEHYSVYLYRVKSVEDAKAKVLALMGKELGGQKKIKHLVLGGHGSPTSLHWGDRRDGTPALEPEDDVTEDFLDAVYPYLMTGNDGEPISTVFLDACLNAKVCRSVINMLNFVAIRLAGTKVYASEISWSNDQLDLRGNGKDFGATIARPGIDRMHSVQLDTEELRDWEFHDATFCGDKSKTHEEGVDDLDKCREACEALPDCRAFVWYKKGNKYDFKKCYLSKGCSSEYLQKSKSGAWTFLRPGMAPLPPMPTPSPTPAPAPTPSRRKPLAYIRKPRWQR